jgi:hypothetical protein
MFCPRCKDEFRPGFSRCASCGVDLVESLSAGSATPAPAAATPTSCSPLALVEYCGFVSLEEARVARNLLSAQAIGTEIAIRVNAEAGGDGSAVEEYWLRVERGRYKEVVRLLGYDEAQAVDEGEEVESFDCGECGRAVSADETFCPGCGARFEGD